MTPPNHREDWTSVLDNIQKILPDCVPKGPLPPKELLEITELYIRHLQTVISAPRKRSKEGCVEVKDFKRLLILRKAQKHRDKELSKVLSAPPKTLRYSPYPWPPPIISPIPIFDGLSYPLGLPLSMCPCCPPNPPYPPTPFPSPSCPPHPGYFDSSPPVPPPEQRQ